MSIPTLDTTIGGAAANSYVTLQIAEDYHDARLRSESWTNASSDDKTRALLMAAQRLNAENWLGSRAKTTQALAWPRLDVQKVDPIVFGFGTGYSGGGYYFADFYLSTEIPQQIKDAQCELALGFLEGFDEAGAEAMDSFTADGVSVKLRSSAQVGDMPSRAAQLIAPLVVGNMLMRG